MVFMQALSRPRSQTASDRELAKKGMAFEEDRLPRLTELGRHRCCEGLAARETLMSVAHFEQERQEMIAAIRVIAEHLADEIGKAALDDRVLRAMQKCRGTSSFRSRSRIMLT
jgi:hypothetical protein